MVKAIELVLAVVLEQCSMIGIDVINWKRYIQLENARVEPLALELEMG
jgi:hypothetical protein